jgi:hypothetical protein
LLTGRGADFYCGLLGILYAGAAYCPLDPAAPADRTASRLAALQPAAVVVDDWSLAERTGVLPVVALVDPGLVRQPAAAPDTGAGRDTAVCFVTDVPVAGAVPPLAGGPLTEHEVSGGDPDRAAGPDSPTTPPPDSGLPTSPGRAGGTGEASPTTPLPDGGLPADPQADGASTADRPTAADRPPAADRPTAAPPRDQPDPGQRLTQADVVQIAQRAVARLDLTEADRVLAFAPPDDPASVWEWSQVLLSGASLSTLPPHPDLDQLRQGLAGVTTATLPSAVAALLRPSGLRRLASVGPVWGTVVGTSAGPAAGVVTDAGAAPAAGDRKSVV